MAINDGILRTATSRIYYKRLASCRIENLLRRNHAPPHRESTTNESRPAALIIYFEGIASRCTENLLTLTVIQSFRNSPETRMFRSKGSFLYAYAYEAEILTIAIGSLKWGSPQNIRTWGCAPVGYHRANPTSTYRVFPTSGSHVSVIPYGCFIKCGDVNCFGQPFLYLLK